MVTKNSQCLHFNCQKSVHANVNKISILVFLTNKFDLSKKKYRFIKMHSNVISPILNNLPPPSVAFAVFTTFCTIRVNSFDCLHKDKDCFKQFLYFF